MYTTRLGQFIFSFPNTQEFHALKREIYSQHSYYLEDDLTAPYIIDAGAHIGMSVAYFKSLWPDATILAIEPNPYSLEYLHHNIEQNQFSQVQVEPVALATHAGQATFYVDPSDEQWQSTASFHPNAWTNTQPGEPIMVQTQPLAKYLTRHVDILKMDIEGAEEKVLRTAGPNIRNIDHIFLEFHGRPGNSLPPIMEMFKENGFECEVWKDGQAIEPGKVVGLALVEAHQKQKKKK